MANLVPTVLCEILKALFHKVFENSQLLFPPLDKSYILLFVSGPREINSFICFWANTKEIA